MTEITDAQLESWLAQIIRERNMIMAVRSSAGRAAVALARIAVAHDRAANRPGHTDLMVSPEAIDDFMERNPLPDDDPVPVTPSCGCVFCDLNLSKINGKHEIGDMIVGVALTIECTATVHFPDDESDDPSPATA